jgi:hypothetical protein
MSAAQEGILEKLEKLFNETGKAHHEAFKDTDGEDLEWPSWYAEKMVSKLSGLLDAKFSISELIYLLVWAEKERSLRSPGSSWARYYDRFFTERYG